MSGIGVPEKMGLPPEFGTVALKTSDGLDGDEWAGRELGGAKLGDARLAKRLVSIKAMKTPSPRNRFGDEN